MSGDFVYLRLHGLRGGARHDYTRAELARWARRLAAAARKGLSGYVYFNNDLNTRAPLNAGTLMRMLGRRAGAAPGGAEPGRVRPRKGRRRPSPLAATRH